MKVKIINTTDEGDYRDGLRIEINDKRVFQACDGEPEDNGLTRNFNDCYNIPKIIAAAFEAGRIKEDLEVEQVEVDWEDF